MSTVVNWREANRGSVDLMTTELNSLADAAGAISPEISNDASSELDMYVDLGLKVTFGTAPDENSVWSIYFVRTVDKAVSFEDYSAEGRPKNGHVGSFVLDNVTSEQDIIVPGILLPPHHFKIYIISDAGQTAAASGNKVTGYFYNEQALAT